MLQVFAVVSQILRKHTEDMRLIMKKSSGIARYVHHPFKNSVEYVF